MSYLALLAGLALLFGGGEAMLRGAVGVARRFGLSEVFVGIAIVGFATSAPELFVSVDAALAGKPQIAFANVVGSNTANLLLILGVGAALSPILCDPRALTRDAAMLTLAVAAAAAISVGGGAGRQTGALLLLALALYLFLAFRHERAAIRATRSAPAPTTEAPETPTLSVPALAGLVILGVLALAAGAEALVWGAVNIAQAAGLSERVIGITLVALGTSLPELATAIVAATRNQSDVAIGNVLGSCVFNVFGILGATAVIAPIAVDPAEFGEDVAVTAFASALVLLLAIVARGLNRPAGAALTVLYAGYIAYVFTGGPA